MYIHALVISRGDGYYFLPGGRVPTILCCRGNDSESFYGGAEGKCRNSAVVLPVFHFSLCLWIMGTQLFAISIYRGWVDVVLNGVGVESIHHLIL